MNKVEYLLSMLMKLPPNFNEIEEELKKNNYSSEDITRVACKFVEECCFECMYFEDEHKRKPSGKEVHGAYVYEMCEIFLKYGLDINKATDENNIMCKLTHVDYEYTAAETMRLLLENGASPNIYIGDESVFQILDFDIVFDVIELDNKELYDKKFKMWILMVGYGAMLDNGQHPIEVLNGYYTEEFKNFENFTYEIEFLENDWIMHIIDIRTGTEVARM